MCRLQLDIHRQIQERLSLSRDHPEEVAADDGAARPQPCGQECARWEGSPVGTTLKYIGACVCVASRWRRGWGFSYLEQRALA